MKTVVCEPLAVIWDYSVSRPQAFGGVVCGANDQGVLGLPMVFSGAKPVFQVVILFMKGRCICMRWALLNMCKAWTG